MRWWKLLLATGVIAAGTALWLGLRHEPGADNGYDVRVETPVLAGRRPRVLFDHGHQNIHSIRGRYRPFAKLLEADGCRVAQSGKALSAETLRGADILVIVNARGVEPDRAAAAFTAAECDLVRDWVRDGGALLLVADHHPCGEAAAALAARFGVQMSGGWTDDAANARSGSGDPGQLLFRRQDGRLGDHPITRGTGSSDHVDVVETFTGQSLAGPADAAPLLLLGESALDRVPVSATVEKRGSRRITTFETDDRSAAGRVQGLALRFGQGRVVVLGEAAMLTAQIEKGQRFGMNSPGNDNRAFTLNVVRWLAGALEG